MHLIGTCTLKSYDISQQLRSVSTTGPWILHLSLVALNQLGYTMAWVLALMFTSGVILTKISRCPSSKPILMNESRDFLLASNHKKKASHRTISENGNRTASYPMADFAHFSTQNHAIKNSIVSKYSP